MRIYLIHPQEFKDTKKNIYKIGRTTQTNIKRVKQYPNDSDLIIQTKCYNCVEVEKTLIRKFKEKFKLIKFREYLKVLNLKW